MPPWLQGTFASGQGRWADELAWHSSSLIVRSGPDCLVRGVLCRIAAAWSRHFNLDCLEPRSKVLFSVHGTSFKVCICTCSLVTAVMSV